MKFDFTNRNIIVLGSSSGIGFEVAKQLAIHKANVCLVGRDMEKLKESYTKINQLSSPQNNNLYVCCDLTNKDSIEHIWENVSKNWNGMVDSLVLNAGGPPFIKSVIDIPETDWLTYFQSLFLSQINLVGKSIEHMKSIGFGRIVSISSSTVAEPLPGLVISSSIRSALIAWLKTLANEVSNYGININTAIIGKVDTQRLRSLDQKRADILSCSVDEIAKDNCKNIPMGRYGTAEEAAGAIMFLLSEYASYINGSSIYIDGGSIKKCF